MATSLLANGARVPSRPKPAQQPTAQPVTPPAKPIELATPAWLLPLLERIAAAGERKEQKPEPKDDDQALVAAIEKLRQEVGPIAELKAEVAKQKERADQLQIKVTELQAQLAQARAQPKPAPAVQAIPQWDTIRVVRGADGFMRDLKLIKE
jgi:chromosome segregation ATPase